MSVILKVCQNAKGIASLNRFILLVTPDTDDKFVATTLCKDDEEKCLKEAGDSTNEASKDPKAETEDKRPRRHSLLRAVLGFKLPKSE